MKLKIVFMGSPDFAIPSLKKLIEEHIVVGVVTQPDRPAGRGKKLVAPPVKNLALAHDIPVIQPRRLKDEGVFEQLTAWNPDLFVVVAFGQILRQNVLDLPKYGCVNVHASILPRWRGAAPIQAALYHGDMKTGVTIMKMDPGIDTGPMLTQAEYTIKEDDTTLSLSAILSEMGAELLAKTLPGYISGEIKPQVQPEDGVSYISMIKKADGLLDFNKSAAELRNQIRAYNPWPGSFFDIDEDRIKVQEALVLEKTNLTIGERGEENGLPAIGTSDGALILKKVQPSGKKPMDGDVFLRGYRNWLA